ncbi:MAG: DNA-packaging protein, partial [Gammaproteobacteria bacterium]|nr:DNA-packaging protein [Gammaproteobacteria bacterium]
TEEELREQFGPKCMPKSFTFIRGRLSENKMMSEAFGEGVYEASLENQTDSDKHSLRDGNWNFLDNPNALWNHTNINANRIKYKSLDEFSRIIIGVDPAGSTGTNSDETGIVACGKGDDGRGYTLVDMTGKYKPEEWAKIVCDLYDTLKADKIVCEKNFGGDMVRSTITAHNKKIIPKLTNSSKGTTARAEPVSLLYGAGQICHVGHELGKLENEMCTWDRTKKKSEQKSPNRMDAMVFAYNELFISQPKRVPRIWDPNNPEGK